MDFHIFENLKMRMDDVLLKSVFKIVIVSNVHIREVCKCKRNVLFRAFCEYIQEMLTNMVLHVKHAMKT